MSPPSVLAPSFKPRTRRKSRTSRECHSTSDLCRPCSTARGSAPVPHSHTWVGKYLSGQDLSLISSDDHESLFVQLPTPFSPSKILWHKVFDSLEVVRLPGIPVLVGDGLPRGHPEELALLGLVSAWGPEVLVAHAWKIYHYDNKTKEFLQSTNHSGVRNNSLSAVVLWIL